LPFKNQHPLYFTWRSMRDRCMNPNSRQWNDYGGRGVKICSRWDSFHTFVKDMGPKPKGCSLDRIDNNQGYSPDNCRWATRKVQQRNRRNTIFVTVGGKKYKAINLAEIAEVKVDTIVERVARGLSYADVVSREKLHNTDGLALGGGANGKRQKSKTHCPQGHEYTPENIRSSKSGYRGCKTCHRDRERRRRVTP